MDSYKKSENIIHTTDIGYVWTKLTNLKIYSKIIQEHIANNQFFNISTVDLKNNLTHYTACSFPDLQLLKTYRYIK